MSFVLSDEQEQLRAAVRGFLAETSGEAAVRRLADSLEGFDVKIWERMAGELALHGLHIPEQYGGQGFSFIELAVVMEEMGRALLSAPFFSSIALAANAILNAGTEEQRRELLPQIASGDRIATLAVQESEGRPDASAIATHARHDGETFLLNGTKQFVIAGDVADLIVVVARRPDMTGAEGVGLFVVDGDASGLSRERLPTLDLTRRQARLNFADVPACLLGVGESNWGALVKTLDQGAACLAIEMVGGARYCLESAVQYAKDRSQFGRPIGSFQAIKHKCADLLIEVEQATAAAYHAVKMLAEESDEMPLAAAVAKAYCSEVYVAVATENIHIHGGLGFTWEHDAHLYFRRARSSAALLGDPTVHRERIAELVIGG